MPVSTLLRNGVFSLSSGTALAQIFGFLASLVLARLYSPTEFGVFSVILGIVSIVGTVASLRFELAIPLPGSEERAHSLVGASVLSAIAACSICAGLILLFGAKVGELYRDPSITHWLWFVPPLSFLFNATLVLTQLAVRHGRFRSVATRSVLQVVAMSTIQVSLGLIAGVRAWGLMAGLACGYAIGALALSGGSGVWSLAARSARKWPHIRSSVRRYIRFPLLLAPSGLLNTLGLQLPLLLLAHFYGPQVAGWLGLTQRVLALPLTLLGTAIAQVYLSELARAARTDLRRAAALFFRSTRLLLIAGTVIAVVLLVAAPTLFSLFLGQKWYASGVYAQAMAVGLAAQMVASPLSQTLIVLERVWTQLGWDVCRVVCIGAVIVITHLSGAGVVQSLWWITLVSLCCYAMSWILSFQAIRGARPNSATSRAIA